MHNVVMRIAVGTMLSIAVVLGFAPGAQGRPIPCPDVILPDGECPADVGAAAGGAPPL